MRRRGFIGMLAAVAGAGVSGVKAGARTVREELRKVGLRRKVVETRFTCLKALTLHRESRAEEIHQANETMVEVAKDINEAIKILMEQGATDIDLRWVNIPDAVIDPDGALGNFRLVGMKCEDPTIRACDLKIRGLDATIYPDVESSQTLRDFADMVNGRELNWKR